MLRLITRGALNSALMAPSDRFAFRVVAVKAIPALVLGLGRDLRPWNEMVEGERVVVVEWCLEIVGARNKVEEDVAAIWGD